MSPLSFSPCMRVFVISFITSYQYYAIFLLGHNCLVLFCCFLFFVDFCRTIEGLLYNNLFGSLWQKNSLDVRQDTTLSIGQSG